MSFDVGHRVVVLEGNAFDVAPARHPVGGFMAGHYGKVTEVGEWRGEPLIAVEIMGHVLGEMHRGIDDTLYAQHSRRWFFIESEIEHID